VNDADCEEKVHKIFADMYLGDGVKNPSITTRLAMLEDSQEKTNKNLNKAIWLVIGTALMVIGEAALKLVVK
jgi:hypothetical protein